jgi:hypothetical protein
MVLFKNCNRILKVKLIISIEGIMDYGGMIAECVLLIHNYHEYINYYYKEHDDENVKIN